MALLQELSIRFAYLYVQYVIIGKKDQYLFNSMYCNDNWDIDLEIWDPLFATVNYKGKIDSINSTEPILA